jgi:hypothetical protein
MTKHSHGRPRKQAATTAAPSSLPVEAEQARLNADGVLGKAGHCVGYRLSIPGGLEPGTDRAMSRGFRVSGPSCPPPGIPWLRGRSRPDVSQGRHRGPQRMRSAGPGRLLPRRPGPRSLALPAVRVDLPSHHRGRSQALALRAGPRLGSRRTRSSPAGARAVAPPKPGPVVTSQVTTGSGQVRLS